MIEQVVQTCSAENLELGCLLIEKASTDKAIRDIDEALEHALVIRREHRETTGEPYFDTGIFNNGSRYPAALPPGLRPRPQDGGLSLEQLAVYDAFQRVPRNPVAPPRDSVVTPGPEPTGALGSVQQGLPQSLIGSALTSRHLTAAQALEKYKAVVASLDVAVQKLLLQPGFHDLPTSSLPADHEVVQQLHFVRSIVAATHPDSRFDVAVVLALSGG